MKKKTSNKNPKQKPDKPKMNFHVNPLFALIIGTLLPREERNGVK